jgi:hypothetical protein
MIFFSSYSKKEQARMLVLMAFLLIFFLLASFPVLWYGGKRHQWPSIFGRNGTTNISARLLNKGLIKELGRFIRLDNRGIFVTMFLALYNTFIVRSLEGEYNGAKIFSNWLSNF